MFRRGPGVFREARPQFLTTLKVMLPQSKESGLREHERPGSKENYGAIRVAAAVPFNTVGAIPVK
jgi:hypothetical protein